MYLSVCKVMLRVPLLVTWPWLLSYMDGRGTHFVLEVELKCPPTSPSFALADGSDERRSYIYNNI